MKYLLDKFVIQMHSTGMSYADAVLQFERQFILEVLAHNNGNQCKAAKVLGMHRNTLNRKLLDFGMDAERIRAGLRRPPTSVVLDPAHSQETALWADPSRRARLSSR